MSNKIDNVTFKGELVLSGAQISEKAMVFNILGPSAYKGMYIKLEPSWHPDEELVIFFGFPNETIRKYLFPKNPQNYTLTRYTHYGANQKFIFDTKDGEIYVTIKEFDVTPGKLDATTSTELLLDRISYAILKNMTN